MMNNDNGKVLYSLREAAERLSIGHLTLRDLARKQKIGHVRLGDNPDKARYKFTPRDLEAYVATLERVEPL